MKRYFFLLISILFFVNVANSQCYPDRHNTNWFDGWISCETAANPNDAYEASHWILYDFNEVLKLGKMHVWNSNDPAHLDYGMKEVSIDYSIDGEDWINLGVFDFDMASGKSIYEGFEGPDFGRVDARYVLLTALSNHGGECFGLSEIRIMLESPMVATEDVQFEMDCSYANDEVLLEWTVSGKIEGTQYAIERSADGQSWTTLDETEAFYLDAGKHKFQFIDKTNTEESAYYRLTSMNSDGTVDHSKTHYCSSKELEARIFPNPMYDEAELEIISKGEEDLYISISNVIGKRVYRSILEPHSISTKIRLGEIISEQGSYFVTIRQGSDYKSLKVVKLGE